MPASAGPRPRGAGAVELHPTAARVAARLADRGLAVQVRMLPDSARTVAEAAAAVGVASGQILKSLVFVRDAKPAGGPEPVGGAEAAGGVEPVLVLCAGDRRVDAERLGLRRADAEQVRQFTGFAIGGVPPLGHERELATLIDSSLGRFETVWAAAGHPHAVFEIATEVLIAALAGAPVLDVSPAV